jgi:hypothetical protein
MRTIGLTLLLTASGWGDAALGTWMVNPARSTFSRDPHLKSVTLRIESHPKGEVFTLDRIEADGRTTTSSTLLYLDGKPRDFQNAECSGTQLSRRSDSQTVELVRTCSDGHWIRFVRRFSAHPNELVLEITKQQASGTIFERRLLLKKQSVGARTPQKR